MRNSFNYDYQEHYHYYFFSCLPGTCIVWYVILPTEMFCFRQRDGVNVLWVTTGALTHCECLCTMILGLMGSVNILTWKLIFIIHSLGCLDKFFLSGKQQRAGPKTARSAYYQYGLVVIYTCTNCCPLHKHGDKALQSISRQRQR